MATQTIHTLIAGLFMGLALVPPAHAQQTRPGGASARASCTEVANMCKTGCGQRRVASCEMACDERRNACVTSNGVYTRSNGQKIYNLRPE